MKIKLILIMLLLATCTAAEWNSTGNVLIMHFNNDSAYGENDTKAYDFSGNGNNGTILNGAVYTTSGKYGNALSFDGSNDYVNAGNASSLNFVANFTIELWVKSMENDDVKPQGIIAKANLGGGFEDGWILDKDMNNRFYFRSDPGFPRNDNATYSDVAYTDLSWHHLAVVNNGSTNILYVDGVQQTAKRTNANISPLSSNQSLVIGTRFSNSPTDTAYSRRFNGTIDEVAVYNRSLLATEILDNYKRGVLRLNLTARSCDDPACSGESFTDVNDISPQNLSVADNRYFQYKFEFETDNANYTPKLYNVTLYYDTSLNNHIIFRNIILNAGDKNIIKYTAKAMDDASEGLNENCVNLTGYDNSSTPYSDGYCMKIKVYRPALEIVKEVSQHDVEPGSEPIITIIIENPTYATVHNISITEFLPRGFNYTDGTAKLDGRPISDPNITGNRTFDCGFTTAGQLNLTWNWINTNYTGTATSALLEIPPKTIKILTFKVHVKCNVQNDTFNNTVNVSGVNGAGGAVGPNSTFFEMKGYLADAEIYKYASTNSPTYFEYVDYKIVIWNNPTGANIAPLTLADIMPPYLKYVPGYSYVGDLKIEPAVCGDYSDKINGTMTSVQNDSSGVNCSGFNGTLVDSAGNKFNGYNETASDGKGQVLLWNLSRWLFLTPGQQVSIKYRTQVIPGIGRIVQNNATLSYLDPEHPELCQDCVFDLSISRTIAVNPPADWTGTEEVNYTLNLKKGWNLISLPITPENTTLAAITSPIEGKYIDVAAWDGGWEYRSYAYGDWFGTLDSIEPKKGYWVNMKEDANLIVHGQAINAFNITLHGGWNLIGWPSTQAMPVENLTVEYVDIATWNGGWIYRSYAYGDWFGDLSSIEPGRGYWINIAGASELSGG